MSARKSGHPGGGSVRQSGHPGSGRQSGHPGSGRQSGHPGSGRQSGHPGSGGQSGRGGGESARGGRQSQSPAASGRVSGRAGAGGDRSSESPGRPSHTGDKSGKDSPRNLKDKDEEHSKDGSEAGSDVSAGEDDATKNKNKKERKSLRHRLHCPKCKCCMLVCPCMYCCHPDKLLDRDTLIRLMTGTGKNKKNVNMVLIEEQLRQDLENCADNKRKWRRRWLICCCCNCWIIVAAVTTVVILLATNDWTLVSESAGFSPRIHFAVTYTAGGELVVAGGTNTLDNYGDVWASTDKGEKWNRLIDIAAFGARHGHALLADSTTGDLLIIGGEGGSVANNKAAVPKTDVWKSTGGREWFLVTDDVPWPARKRFGSAIDLEGKLYIVGGIDSMGITGLNDMWMSEDKGYTWSAVALASPWSARHSFGFVRMPGGTRTGRLLIMGGSDGRAQHDIWASDDIGLSWHLMTFTHVREMVYRDVETRASWGPRFGTGAVADKEGLITLSGGGSDEAEEAFSREVWTLESPPPDTVPWYAKRTNDARLNVDRYPRQWQIQGEPAWSARRFLQSFVDEEGVVYIIGGQETPGASGLKNDIWKKVTSLDLENLKNAYDQAQGGGAGAEQDAGEETRRLGARDSLDVIV